MELNKLKRVSVEEREKAIAKAVSDIVDKELNASISSLELNGTSTKGKISLELWQSIEFQFGIENDNQQEIPPNIEHGCSTSPSSSVVDVSPLAAMFGGRIFPLH